MDPSKQTEALLNEIYKNAAMGAGTVTHLLEGKRSPALKESLARQKAEYNEICLKAEQALRRRNKDVEGLSAMEKMRTDIAVTANTLFDRSDAQVAKLLMNGSTMGVINAQKSITEYPDAEGEARDLMRRLSDFEEETLEKMKLFL